MNVINCCDLIAAQLNSIYQHADEIIIIEGAYRKFSVNAPNATSTDDTVRNILTFPDPENKIKLFTNNAFFDDRAEMCSEIVRNATGDILFQVDVDEFYQDSTHRFVRQAFEESEELDQISFMFVDFFFRPDLYVAGTMEKGLNDVRRVFRLRGATHFISQRPPILGKNGSELNPRKRITGDQLKAKDHLMLHATAVTMRQIKEKTRYYNKMWGINNNAEDNYSLRGIDLLNAHGIPRYLTPIVKTEVDIPEAMKPVFALVDKEILNELELKLNDKSFVFARDLAVNIIQINKPNYVISVPRFIMKIFKLNPKRSIQFCLVLTFCIIRLIRMKFNKISSSKS